MCLDELLPDAPEPPSVDIPEPEEIIEEEGERRERQRAGIRRQALELLSRRERNQLRSPRNPGVNIPE